MAFPITCGGASNLSTTSAQLNGTASNAPLNNTMGFRWGTVQGGPYPNTTGFDTMGANVATQPFNATITGLDPDTTYYYVAVGRDANGVEDSISSECSFTTTNNIFLEKTTDGPINRFVGDVIESVVTVQNRTSNVITNFGPPTQADFDAFTILSGAPYWDPDPCDSCSGAGTYAGIIMNEGDSVGQAYPIPVGRQALITGSMGEIFDPNDFTINVYDGVSNTAPFVTTLNSQQLVDSNGTTLYGPFNSGNMYIEVIRNTPVTGPIGLISDGLFNLYVADSTRLQDVHFFDPVPTQPPGTTRTWTAELITVEDAFTPLIDPEPPLSGTGDIDHTYDLAYVGGVRYTIRDTIMNEGFYRNTAIIESPDSDINPWNASGQLININVRDNVLIAKTTNGPTTQPTGSTITSTVVVSGDFIVQDVIRGGMFDDMSEFDVVQGNVFWHEDPNDFRSGAGQAAGLVFNNAGDTLGYLFSIETPDMFEISATVSDNANDWEFRMYDGRDNTAPLIAAVDGAQVTGFTTYGPCTSGNVYLEIEKKTDATDVPPNSDSFLIDLFIRDIEVAHNVHFQDPVPTTPAGITRTWTAVVEQPVSPLPALSGTGAIDHTYDIGRNGKVTYTILDTVPTAGVYENTATIDSDEILGDAPDTTTGHREATGQQITLTDAPVVDIDVDKTTTTPPPYEVGQPIFSTLVITNNGDAVTGVVISDPLPPNVAATRTFTSSVTGGATGNTANGVGAINDTVDMPVGSTITYTIVDTPAAAGTYQNTVTVTPDGEPPIIDTGGPETPVDPPLAPNITVDKNTPAGPFTVGTPIISTIVISNTGNAPATAVQVQDPLPANTTRTFTAAATGNASGFTANGTGAIDEFVNLDAGATITYTITDTVSVAGTYQNIVTVTPTGGPPIIDTGGPETPVDPPPAPDIDVTKDTPDGPYQVGIPIISTIVITNNGNATATNYHVVDTIRPNITRSFTSAATGGATGNTASGTGTIDDTLTIPAGSTITYTISDTPTALGVYQNSVTVTPDGGPPEVIVGGPEFPIEEPPIPPVAANLCLTDFVKLCTQTNIALLCNSATNTPIILVGVASSDGDIIPTTSTEFPVGAGHGAFSTLGYVRSYYTDLSGNILNPQPTSIAASCTGVNIDPEIVCLVPNGSPVGTQPLVGVVVYDVNVNPPTATYFIGNTNVTATHTQVNCNENLDYEELTACYQETANPDNKFTRIDWFDKSDLDTPVQTVWFNVNTGVFSTTAPVGIEACSESEKQDVEDVVAHGCANGINYLYRRVTRFSQDTGLQLSVEEFWYDPQGNQTTVRPVGFDFGTCTDPIIGLGNDLELGCVNGETWTHRRFAYYNTATGQQVIVVDGYFNPQGVEQPNRPAGWTVGPCVRNITTEPACLSGTGSADLTNAERCEISAVELNGERVEISLQSNWRVEDLVNAVNAVRPNALTVNEGQIVGTPNGGLTSFTIICVETEWIDWNNSANAGVVNRGTTMTGTLPNSGVGVTYTSNLNIFTENNVFNHGVFPTVYHVPNNTQQEIVRNTQANTHTITFASPVAFPTVVFASIGQAGVPVPINFSTPVELIFQQSVTQPSPTQIIGTEGYAIARVLSDSVTSFTFTYTQAENWNNFVFGRAEFTRQEFFFTPDGPYISAEIVKTFDNTGAFTTRVWSADGQTEFIRNANGTYGTDELVLNIGSCGDIAQLRHTTIQTAENDLIKTNWLPICVSGSQWYVAERSIFDNTTSTEGTITKIYKQGANGAVVTVAPVGTIVEGYCTTTVVNEVGCIATITNPVPAFFPAFPPTGEWLLSTNSGASFAVAPASNTHGAQAAEVRRWRSPEFTIPAGLGGTWDLIISGDIFDAGQGGSFGRWYLDGLLIDPNTGLSGGPHITTIPIEAGPHTVEWREGASSITGSTIPNFSASYTNVTSERTTRQVEAVKVVDSTGTILSQRLFESDGVTEITLGTGDTYTAGQCEPSEHQVSVYRTCADVPREEIVFGGNLLGNGDLELSTGVGATSVAGPTWTTSYAASGQIFTTGQDTYAFFTTNAGQVTGNWGTAVPIQALGARSMAVNVGSTLTTPIVQWTNIYLENGKSYSIGADVAVINFPASLALRIDGNLITPITMPTVASVWTRTADMFVWTGTSGFHTVSLNTNTTSGPGNDIAIDNFTLRMVEAAQDANRTDLPYSNSYRAVIDQIVETTNCNDDRRDEILGTIAQSLQVGTERDLVLGTAIAICIENPVGTFTNGHVRENTIFNNGNATSVTTIQYSTNGSTWTNTVPTGTIRLGSCNTGSISTTNTATPARITATAAGNTAAGLQSVSFINVGTTNATVAGQPLLPGESVDFEGYFDNAAGIYRRLPSIAYVGSATAIIHISTVA